MLGEMVGDGTPYKSYVKVLQVADTRAVCVCGRRACRQAPMGDRRDPDVVSPSVLE